MSLGADLENTSLAWLDRVTETSNGTVERNNRVLASSAERLVQELSGVYEKIQTRDRGQAEAQQLNARLQNLGDLLDPGARKVLQDRMATDLTQAQKMGGQSATDLAKLLGDTSDNLKRNSKPNTAAIDNAGKRLGDFWAKENTLFRDRVTALTQQAAAEGKSWRLLSNQVRELLILERRAGTESARSRGVNAKLGITGRAELIARTEMQTAYIQGQLGKFRDMGYDWARWSATAERSCPYCIARDGLVYQLQEVESAIPAHPRCRCSLIPADAPANWGKGNNGVEAAESLDDAYWARSRSQKVADFRKNNPRFTDAELIRYVNTPTNSQAYLRPGQPAAQPVWSPSGSLIPNLQQVVMNAAAAARNMQAREQRAESAEAERLEQERERLEVEAAEAERLAAEQQRLQQEADKNTRLLRQETADLERQLIEARQKGTADQESIAEQIAKLREQISRNEVDARAAGEAIDALNKRQVELNGELERVTNERNLRNALQSELDSAQLDANALNDRRGKAFLEKFQAEQRLKIAREKLADLENAAAGKGGEFDVEAYDRTIAQQNHDVETLQRIGEDVLKRAGVSLTEVQQPAAGDTAAELDQLKTDRTTATYRIAQKKKNIAAAKKNIKISLENQEYAIERVTNRHKRGEIDATLLRVRIEEIKTNTARATKNYEDYLVDGGEALTRLENQLANIRVREAELQKTTTRSAAQAVLDELYRTSPITKAEAAAEVELAANATRKAAAKRTSQDKVSLRPVPKDMGLEHMTDAVHLYGTRSSMDAYGLKTDRAHASNRKTAIDTGEETRFANGDRAIGYINSGDTTGDYRGTQFHELGHHLEFQNSDFYRAARKFIESRKATPDERPTWLGGNFGRDEIGYKGKAYRPYVLKEYDLKRVEIAERYVAGFQKDSMTKAKREWLEGRDYTDLHRRLGLATEVVSMGVEKLSSQSNLQRLAEMDPEHMLLSLGMVKVQQARARVGKEVFGRSDAAGPVATVKDIPDGSGGSGAVDKAALKRLKQEAEDLDKVVKRVEAELETIARDSDKATEKARAVFDELAKMPPADELKAQNRSVLEQQDTANNDKISQIKRKRELEGQIETDQARLAKLEQQAAEQLTQAEAQVQDLETRLAQVKKDQQERLARQQAEGPPERPAQDQLATDFTRQMTGDSWTQPGRSFGGADVARMVTDAAKLPDSNYRRLQQFVVANKQTLIVAETMTSIYKRATGKSSFGAEPTAKDVPWALTDEYASIIKKSLIAEPGEPNIFDNFERIQKELDANIVWEKNAKQKVAELKAKDPEDYRIGPYNTQLREVRKNIKRAKETLENKPGRLADLALGDGEGFTNKFTRRVVLIDDFAQNLHDPFDSAIPNRPERLTKKVEEILAARSGPDPLTDAQKIDTHSFQDRGSREAGLANRNELILYTFIHETGHQVYYRADSPPPPKIKRAPTDYATTNEDELFAESWSAYVMNPRKLKEFDPAIYKWVDDAYVKSIRKTAGDDLPIEPAVELDGNRRPAASESTPVEDRVGRMAAADIEADPSRFQYKINANKDTGEVGSLRGVETWNEDLAGVLSVWKDPANGQTYVINGHNRLALAKRLGVTDMPVLYVQAKTATEARAIGAKQNIANGDGTAIDAAKFMRDTGQRSKDMLAQGLNLKGKVARDGADLAELPDFMFNAVAEGRLSVEHGSAIGRSGLSQGQMADAYKVLQDRPSMSPATLDEVLLAARASQSRVREETTLFGTDKVETSTMIERAELAAKVRAEQGREVRTLDKAAGKADVLATRGNRIDVQQAQVRAAEAQARADVFDLLKNRPTSKVAKALNDAAAKIQDATNRTAKGKATSESRALVDAAIDAEIAQMAGSDKGLLRSIADLKAKRAGEFANPPELELAVAPADLTLERVPARLINPETAKAGTIGSVRPDQIKADAKRFQYKAATDAQTGEVGSLEGVRRYDPALAGVISVWKDPSDGVTYVINGHNRLAAARRLGADAVSVRYISASNPAEARAIGALANIAEGQGTAIDAAKFMREMGYGAEDMKAMGVPLKKSAARDGANLASLPDPLWELVVQERLSVDKASEIGGSGLDAEGMAKVADTLSKRPNASLGTVRELVAAEKASMDQGTTLSLFNDPADATYQLDRAQLTRGVRDELLGDKRLFGTLATSRAAQTLEDAGSTLDTDANRQASAEADRVLAVFDQLKNVSGPVSEALNRGARQLAEAKTASERLKVQRQIRLEVVEAVAQELKGVPSDAPEPPPEAPGQVGLFG